MSYQGFDASLYLEHYGVKGMKWGVRKRIQDYRRDRNARLNRRNENYNRTKRSNDELWYGKKGVERINRRMNKGRTYKSAKRRETALQVGMGLASGALLFYGTSKIADGGIQKMIKSARTRKAATKALRIGAGVVINLKKNQYKVY